VSQTLGLYVHVPFCRTRCRYCDFYRVGENAARQTSFLAALHREIAGTTEFHGQVVDTVFFGGGTPSLLDPAEIRAVLAHLREVFSFAADTEVTAECNPSDLDPHRLAGLWAAGLNRLSLGVQSFCDRELRLLGRRHDAQRAIDAVRWAREVGFDNLSLDLMVAIPGQTDASFRRSVEQAVALRPDHMSLYLLEVHGGSEMDFLRRERPRLFPGEDAERRRYFALSASLEAAGYEHYEIANFCRPGRAARHNLKYWRCEPTLGFGPSAHSFVGGRRFRRPPNLVAYLADPLVAEDQVSDVGAERIFLGLRLAEGVVEVEAQRAAALGAPAWEDKLTRLAPFLTRRDGRLRLSPEGLVVSTAVIADLLAAAPAVSGGGLVAVAGTAGT
jgi:putative oxygen-independent coproporphyrinogen III oxidase